MTGCNERALWKYIKDGMGSTWDACRHEDTTRAGIPDVSFGVNGRNGWLELKAVAALRRRSGSATIANIRNLRPAQAAWLTARGRAGGNVWLLVRVGTKFHALVPWTLLRLVVENGVWAPGAAPYKVWPSGINFAELREILGGKIPTAI